ncbi:HD domain-containing protein [Streptomyces sp. NPDC052773]|uniref:HD domain-containing protein n=1 Tax=Streptomyces sp. NPDC052773 TaxID=3365693 RepID=UPI0037D5FE15
MSSALDTPQGAAELAESLLPPLGNRWLHTQAVAARAREASAAVSEADRDLLVAAAWLHDIGYAPELRDTGFHPLDGARHLESLGAPGTTGIPRRTRGPLNSRRPWPPCPSVEQCAGLP